MKCPKCGKTITIIAFTNWDNLTTYYYPICNNCNWTTKQTFDNKKQIEIYMKESDKIC